jgi:hypothetical protein
MNVKIIINSLILLFILHILIINSNIHYTFGNKKIKKEYFSNIDTNIDKNIDTNIDKNIDMNIDTNIDTNDTNEFKKKLLKYLQQDEIMKDKKFIEKNSSEIMPSNVFMENENTSNFETNISDISKFYTINTDINNLDNLNENKLKETFTNEQNNKQRNPEIQPDYWNYKNELPMNGGSMSGIVGFDTLESQYASYNPNAPIQNSEKTNVAHDDLRKPIIYE